jgi:mono/diheme cytochrome c family protein
MARCRASRRHVDAYNGTTPPPDFFMKLLVLCLFLLVIALPASAAELRIDLGHGVKHYSTAQLLGRSDLSLVTIPADVAFKRTMHYRAVPLRALLDGLAAGDHLQFVAGDGFAAEIPATAVLNHRGSEAWLAIEDPAHPWPAVDDKAARAGPFYIVWTHPHAAGIGPEQWPYQLAVIRRLDNVTRRFPAIMPDPALPPDSDVQRGFVLFQHTCFACHTLNGEGDARLGPDLNIPHNPTEYLRTDLLRAFIRNPQSLHRWPQAKMHGFDAKALSDADLDALLAYMRHMAGRKAGP